MGFIGRKGWGWSRNIYLIPTPWFINITDELVCSYFLLLPAWSTTENIWIFGQRGVRRSQICFKFWVWLAENDKVWVEIHIWFPPHGSQTSMQQCWPFIGKCMIYNHIDLCFWSKRRKKVRFDSNSGFDWQKMVRLKWKCIYDSHPRVHKSYWWTDIHFLLVSIWCTAQHTCDFDQRGVNMSQICFKMMVWLVENADSGVKIHIWLLHHHS